MNSIDAQLNCEDTSLYFKREVSCFITPEHGVISLATGVSSNDDNFGETEGCGGSVDFDWFKIWGFLKKQSVPASKAIMIHSHPPGMLNRSSTDDNMVRGWCLGLGMPIVFCIVTHDNAKDLSLNILYVANKNNKIVIEDENDSCDKQVNASWFQYFIVSQIVYGMSKADELTGEDVEEIEKEMKESKLRVE